MLPRNVATNLMEVTLLQRCLCNVLETFQWKPSETLHWQHCNSIAVWLAKQRFNSNVTETLHNVSNVSKVKLQKCFNIDGNSQFLARWLGHKLRVGIWKQSCLIRGISKVETAARDPVCLFTFLSEVLILYKDCTIFLLLNPHEKTTFLTFFRKSYFEHIFSNRIPRRILTSTSTIPSCHCS